MGTNDRLAVSPEVSIGGHGTLVQNAPTPTAPPQALPIPSAERGQSKPGNESAVLSRLSRRRRPSRMAAVSGTPETKMAGMRSSWSSGVERSGRVAGPQLAPWWTPVPTTAGSCP